MSYATSSQLQAAAVMGASIQVVNRCLWWKNLTMRLPPYRRKKFLLTLRRYDKIHTLLVRAIEKIEATQVIYYFMREFNTTNSIRISQCLLDKDKDWELFMPDRSGILSFIRQVIRSRVNTVNGSNEDRKRVVIKRIVWDSSDTYQLTEARCLYDGMVSEGLMPYDCSGKSWKPLNRFDDGMEEIVFRSKPEIVKEIKKKPQKAYAMFEPLPDDETIMMFSLPELFREIKTLCSIVNYPTLKRWGLRSKMLTTSQSSS